MPAPDARIRFLLDGQRIELGPVDPSRTLLQFLREDLGRCGTKEGCAEGDCGACTVAVVDLQADAGSGERPRVRAVNACIQFLIALDGKALLTVESLAPAGAPLHPVQQALVDCHASQCGFCTPGFVMSLFALFKQQLQPSRAAINQALAGNLCRCTGYRPIVAAAERMYELAESITPTERAWLNRPGAAADADADALIDALRALRRTEAVEWQWADRQLYAPRNLATATALLRRHPEACLLAGGTDVGLWVTKQLRQPQTILYLGAVAELRGIERGGDWLDIGAAVPLTDAVPAILADYPQLAEVFERFASPPIRNCATLGGNIANASPIGDAIPSLIAIGTKLVLAGAGSPRELALEEYFLDYQQTARKPDELIRSIRLPRPSPALEVAVYKVSKRHDQDISAVCAAFAVVVSAHRVSQARIAYGGMAATPRRASNAEAALRGQEWNESSITQAMQAMDLDFSPLSDQRASAAYRATVARNLLYRFFLEHSDFDGLTRVGQG